MPEGEEDASRSVLHELSLRFFKRLLKAKCGEHLIPTVFPQIKIEQVRDEKHDRRYREDTKELNIIIAREENAKNNHKTPREVPSGEQHSLDDGTHKYGDEAILLKIQLRLLDDFFLRRQVKEHPHDIEG